MLVSSLFAQTFGFSSINAVDVEGRLLHRASFICKFVYVRFAFVFSSSRFFLSHLALYELLAMSLIEKFFDAVPKQPTIPGSVTCALVE